MASSLCSKKCCEDKHVDLLLIEERGEKHYVLITDFNKFMYNFTLDCERRYFCYYCLQAFSTEEILKRYIIVCLKINSKQKCFSAWR